MIEKVPQIIPNCQRRNRAKSARSLGGKLHENTTPGLHTPGNARGDVAIHHQGYRSLKLEPPCVLEEDVTLLPVKRYSGIYFLCRGTQVIYIGASKDVVSSVHNPDVARDAWDRAYYRRVPASELRRVKREMVEKYLPIHNMMEAKHALA